MVILKSTLSSRREPRKGYFLTVMLQIRSVRDKEVSADETCWALGIFVVSL